MLTTQESLEALAGRSPYGKPLVFVSQQDYDALRKKYEAVLETTKQSKRDPRALSNTRVNAIQRRPNLNDSSSAAFALWVWTIGFFMPKSWKRPTKV